MTVGRVLAAFGEDAGDEAGRGRLAVRAGDRDGIAEAHQLPEHLGARHHRNACLQRRPHFRVVARHRARGDHHIGAGDVGRRVTDGDACAESREPVRHGAGAQVRPCTR